VAIVALLCDPRASFDLLRAGEVPLATAVEELLRYTPIAASGGTIRVALDDIEVGGVTVRAGEGVLPATTSANRDGRVFTDPDRLDVARRPNPHLAVRSRGATAASARTWPGWSCRWPSAS